MLIFGGFPFRKVTKLKLFGSIAIIALAAIGSAQVFSDDFNRADGGLGANYTAVSGSLLINGNAVVGAASANGLTLVNSGVISGSYLNSMVQADLSVRDQSSTLTYSAIAFGHDGSTTVNHGIFVKLQRQTAGGFANIGFYTGAGSNGTGIVTSGGNFQTLATPITSARMTIKMLDATTLYTGLDTNFDSVDDVTYSSTLNLGLMVLGNQFGLHVFGNTGQIDNYKATVVPEPVSMVALGMGVLALARKRRKG